MNCILKGSIQITDNLNFVRDIVNENIPNTKIVSLDEEGNLPLNHPNVLGGSCLLPPMDAMIAEQDGDAQLYTSIYTAHFDEPFVQQFIGALLTYIFNGGNILIYCPDIGTMTMPELRKIFWNRFGINIGITAIEPGSFNNAYTSMWLAMMYLFNTITPKDYLLYFPINEMIPENIMNKLVNDILPPGDNYTEQIGFINDLKVKIKEKPNVIIPIYKI